MDRDELSAWLRLELTAGVGPGTARRLLAAFGLPQAIFEQPTAALQRLAPPAAVAALRQVPEPLPALLEATWAWLQDSPGRHVLTLADAAYPAALLATEDPPPMLYLTGAPPLPDWSALRCIAMVGTRHPTPQGAENARQFGRHFTGLGIAVASGLARGIDAAAHQGALEGAPDGMLATIAVVGTGLDRVYPKQNLELARAIAARGLLVSEYPLGTPPLAANFPRRNRIIAALSQGTLVVEAAQPSGSLITARIAAEQGKEVFAIPGSIHSPQSRGCHALIRQGAKLVESARDVLEELRLPAAAPGAGSAAPSADPRGDGASAIDSVAPGAGGTGAGSENGPWHPAPEDAPAADRDGLLPALDYDPVGLDALSARTGLDAAALQVRLLELELDGQVARLPGGLFQRVGSA
ncbi:MAG: DNA-processing protein DprA [Xylophilus ampelinus]